MWLRTVYFIVDPTSRLLYSELAPLVLSEKFPLVVHFLVDFFGEDHMPVFIVIIEVFIRVFDLGGIVWHKYNNCRIRMIMKIKY